MFGLIGWRFSSASTLTVTAFCADIDSAHVSRTRIEATTPDIERARMGSETDTHDRCRPDPMVSGHFSARRRETATLPATDLSSRWERRHGPPAVTAETIAASETPYGDSGNRAGGARWPFV